MVLCKLLGHSYEIRKTDSGGDMLYCTRCGNVTPIRKHPYESWPPKLKTR